MNVIKDKDLNITASGWSQFLVKVPLSDFEVMPQSGDKITFNKVVINGSSKNPTLTVLSHNGTAALCQVEKDA